MLELSALLFGIAALGGAYLATRHLREQPVRMSLALGHGTIAATALALLVRASITSEVGLLVQTALVLFVGVALGGFILLAFHIGGRALPIPLVLLHGGAALVALIVLGVGLLR